MTVAPQLAFVMPDGLDEVWRVPTAHPGISAWMLLEVAQPDWPAELVELHSVYALAVIDGRCSMCAGCRPSLPRATRRLLRRCVGDPDRAPLRRSDVFRHAAGCPARWSAIEPMLMPLYRRSSDRTKETPVG